MRKCSKPASYIYIVMNKPCGYVCAAASDSHKNVYELLTSELQELVKKAPRGQRLHTIGRLDCDTSGLLLLTNDGLFSHKIAAKAEIGMMTEGAGSHPTGSQSGDSQSCGSQTSPTGSQSGGSYTTSSQRAPNSAISKSYRAKLAAPVKPDLQILYIKRAAEGLTLPPEKKVGEQECEPAQITFITEDNCEITVHEGKFHEVRRIFRALGNEVKTLERIAIGKLKLPEDLAPGQWRALTENEKLSIFSKAYPDV